MKSMSDQMITVITFCLLSGYAVSFDDWQPVRRPSFSRPLSSPFNSYTSRPRCYPHCCTPISTPNGMVRLTRRTARFSCQRNYTLIGEAVLYCHRNKWEPEIPVCAASGCVKLKPPRNGLIKEEYKGTLARIDCNPGYIADESVTVYCDGRFWNASFNSLASICKKSSVTPATSCDFESRDTCGWNSEEPERVTIEGPSSVSYTLYGLSPADHTTGEGHMLVIWNSAAIDSKVNSSNRLYSPVYESKESESCFVFWYHLGGYIGNNEPLSIKLYIKQEYQELGEVESWEVHTSQEAYGKWQRAHLFIPKVYQDFQIVMEFQIWNKIYALDDLNTMEASECARKTRVTSNTTESSDNWPSCKGRCNATETSPVYCSCGTLCLYVDNCCPDYQEYCLYNSTSTNDTSEVMNDDDDDDVKRENGTRSTSAVFPINPSWFEHPRPTGSSIWWFSTITSSPTLNWKSVLEGNATTTRKSTIDGIFGPKFNQSGPGSGTTQKSSVLLNVTESTPLATSPPLTSPSSSPATGKPIRNESSMGKSETSITGRSSSVGQNISSEDPPTTIKPAMTKPDRESSHENPALDVGVTMTTSPDSSDGFATSSNNFRSKVDLQPESEVEAKLSSALPAESFHIMTTLIISLILVSLVGIYAFWRRHARISQLGVSEDSELRYLAQDEEDLT